MMIISMTTQWGTALVVCTAVALWKRKLMFEISLFVKHRFIFYSIDFDWFRTFCPMTRQFDGALALCVCGDGDGCDAFIDPIVSMHIFVMFEHSPEQHCREFMHYSFGSDELKRFDNLFHWKKPPQQYRVIHYLPNVHLRSMHSTDAAALCPVLVSMEHRCVHLTLASNAFASYHRCRQNDRPALQHYWHFALAIRDSIDSDCCSPYCSHRCGFWHICTNKWGNYSNSIRNDTDTKRKQNGAHHKNAINDWTHQNTIKFNGAAHRSAEGGCHLTTLDHLKFLLRWPRSK